MVFSQLLDRNDIYLSFETYFIENHMVLLNKIIVYFQVEALHQNNSQPVESICKAAATLIKCETFTAVGQLWFDFCNLWQRIND